MNSLLQILGHKLGQTAASAKNVIDLMSGGDDDSRRVEVRLGQDLEAVTLEQTPLAPESRLTQFTADIGGWLVNRLANNRLTFVFHVTAEPTPNAFALPGGPIFISRPLLELCQGQRDEIAFILAHEMGHIVLRHAVERMVSDTIFSMLLRQTTGRHAIVAWLGRVGQKALSRAYSREQELEADTFAADLLRDCGGEIQAGAQLFQKLARAPTGGGLTFFGEYFATHPPLPERLAHLGFQISDLKSQIAEPKREV